MKDPEAQQVYQDYKIEDSGRKPRIGRPRKKNKKKVSTTLNKFWRDLRPKMQKELAETLR